MSGRDGIRAVGASVQRLRSLSAKNWLSVVAVALVVAFVGYVLSPLAAHGRMLGYHDWDQMEAHRYLVQKSILRYGQFPFWNPYGCGGHSAWGGIESDTIVVSPWIPIFLLAPVSIAIRIEVIGTAIFGAVGTWMLASRFTRSGAFRAFLVIVWTLNGRWALQVTAGHTWELDYAWMPWLFFLIDRASGTAPTDRWRPYDVVMAAVCFALLVYAGAIYPLPQTVLALGIYVTWLAVVHRSLRPILVLGFSGILGIGLSLPKLLPMLVEMHRFPRLVTSSEVFDLGTLTDALLTRQHQDEFLYYPPGQKDAWHEWGMYLGGPALFLLVAGMFEARGIRERALKWIGLLFFLVSLGAFHKLSPWAQLHHLPIFESQHLPSRWLYVALLPIACATAAAAERLLTVVPRRRVFLEAGALAIVAWIAGDIGSISRATLARTFTHPPFSAGEVLSDFHTEQHLPPSIPYEVGAWGSASLPAEVLNFGTIDCITSPGLATPERLLGHATNLGAHGVGDSAYHGEVYIPEQHGSARIESFTPNEFVVTVEGATPGDHLVLNQNWDPGWTVNGGPSVDVLNLNTALISSPDQRFVFRYRSPMLGAGLAGCAATIVVILAGLATLRGRSARPPVKAHEA